MSQRETEGGGRESGVNVEGLKGVQEKLRPSLQSVNFFATVFDVTYITTTTTTTIIIYNYIIQFIIKKNKLI